MRVRLGVFFLVLLAIVGFTGCAATSIEENTEIRQEEALSLHIIDVGQGDSILIIGPESTLLIDGGNNADGEMLVDYLEEVGVEKIDVLIGTHPHEDHIGGLDTVIANIPVEKVYLPKVSHTTKTFKDLLQAIKDQGLRVATAQKGTLLSLPDMEGEFLSPLQREYGELNEYSAVLRIGFGNKVILLMGDAEKVNEEKILSAYPAKYLKADILKLGHHGSSSSSSPEFLDTVDPSFSVISLEKGNDYGHPHRETLEALQERGIPLYRTDEAGTIIFTINGDDITVNQNPGSYSPGEK
jgi:competence protein ComEC